MSFNVTVNNNSIEKYSTTIEQLRSAFIVINKDEMTSLPCTSPLYLTSKNYYNVIIWSAVSIMYRFLLPNQWLPVFARSHFFLLFQIRNRIIFSRSFSHFVVSLLSLPLYSLLCSAPLCNVLINSFSFSHRRSKQTKNL